MRHTSGWAQVAAGAVFCVCAGLLFYVLGGETYRMVAMPGTIGAWDAGVTLLYTVVLCTALYLCGRRGYAGVPAGVSCVGIVLLVGGLIGYLGYASAAPVLASAYFVLAAPFAPALEWGIEVFALYEQADALMILMPCTILMVSALFYLAGALPAMLRRRTAVSRPASGVLHSGKAKDGIL